MALPKLFQRIFWHNNTTPALNEDNLNSMSKAIDDIDDRVIALGDDVITIVPQIQAYLEQAEDLVEAMELLSENPPYIGANGNWYVWDTNTSAFVDSGVDASISVDIADVTAIAPDATPYVTNTGTDTDPVFHLFIPRGQKGETGETGATGPAGPTGPQGPTGDAATIAVGTVTTLPAGSNATVTNAGTSGAAVFNFGIPRGADGSGSGDMSKSDYDSDSTVKNAGGIKAWVQSLGYITGLAWSALTGKPFSSVGSGLTVSSDALTADIKTVTIGSTGTASSSAANYQRVGVNGSYTEVRGSRYMETSTYTTSGTNRVFTFTNVASTAVIDGPYCDKIGVSPTAQTHSGTTYTVSFATSDAVGTVRIYLK